MSLTRAEYDPVCEQEVHLGRVWGVPRVTDRSSVLRVRNCCLVLIWAPTTGKLQLDSDLPVQVLLLVTLLVLHFPPVCYIIVCFFILWWQTGRFPGTTVTVKWQWVMQMWGFGFFCIFFFSLFLKGEDLFLPIYSLCVCVNTFILNLKLIKYHFSKMSPDVGVLICLVS